MKLLDVLNYLNIKIYDIETMYTSFPTSNSCVDKDGGLYDKEYDDIGEIFNAAINMNVPFHIDFFIKTEYWLEDKTQQYAFILFRTDGTPYIQLSDVFLLTRNDMVDDYNKELIKIYQFMEII